MKVHLTQSSQRSQRFGFTVACGERKMLFAVSARSNEVGVIFNPTVSELPYVKLVPFRKDRCWAGERLR